MSQTDGKHFRARFFLDMLNLLFRVGGRIEQAEAITDHRGHAPITNRSSGSIRNDYCWLRERGVCTRPALGIYIETNPISLCTFV